MGIGTLRRYHPSQASQSNAVVEPTPGAPVIVNDSPLDPTPGKSGKKADWEAYALAHGKTAEDIKGLKRDDIAALFPDPAYPRPVVALASPAEDEGEPQPVDADGNPILPPSEPTGDENAPDPEPTTGEGDQTPEQ